MATAAVAAGGATGIRAWLAAKGFSWLTPRRLTGITLVLIAAALVVAATLSGTGS
jgi:uncharacterized protein (TIGR03382 family)